jgi:uncharacterized membrane protein YuzA (DUF378 family)
MMAELAELDDLNVLCQQPPVRCRRHSNSPSNQENAMKKFDVLAAVLVVVGALNWGLVGTIHFNLVAAIFGATIVSSIVYALVGIAGLYQVLEWKAIQRRWQKVPG